MRKLIVNDSSNVAAVAYDPVQRKLRVVFKNGGEYEYSNVTPEMFCDLVSAGSMGSYVARFRSLPLYACRKVEEVQRVIDADTLDPDLPIG